MHCSEGKQRERGEREREEKREEEREEERQKQRQNKKTEPKQKTYVDFHFLVKTVVQKKVVGHSNTVRLHGVAV